MVHKPNNSQRQQRRGANLAAWARDISPDLVTLVENHKPRSKLINEAGRDADVKLADGSMKYGGHARRMAERQVEKFLEWNLRIAFPKPEPGIFDVRTNIFLNRVLSRASDAGIRFADNIDGNKSFFLLIAGIGLGYHIDRLIDETGCAVVFFLEPDVDMLSHSLDVFDWAGLTARMAARGGQVFIATEPDPALLANQVRNQMRLCNFPASDGTLCFTHDHDELMKSALTNFARDVRFMSFTGFFLDESLMLKNTYRNLKCNGIKLFERQKVANIGRPTFLVGSGPSLDDGVDFLKKNRDNIIVVSNGTALRPLLVNGIEPDFHVEIENIYVYSGIQELSRNYDLSNICLVAPTTVDPYIIDAFRRIIFFFRDSTNPFPLFSASPDTVLRAPEPTVVNAGLAFLIDSGFTNIHFIGIDLGIKDGGQHHSKDHHHYSEDVILEDYRKYPIAVPANFDGQAMTSIDLLAAGGALSDAARACRGEQRFYNCSDGARIDGAAAKRIDDVICPPVTTSREQITADFIDRYRDLPETMFADAWQPGQLHNAIDDICDTLATPGAAQEHFLTDARIHAMVKSVMHSGVRLDAADMGGRRQRWAAYLMRGTLLLCLMSVWFYHRRIPDAGERAWFDSIVRDELLGAIEDLRQSAHDVIENPDDIPPPRTTKDPRPEDFIGDVFVSWGKVARNATCPCGSGKRYKQCHGRYAT